MNIQVRNAKLDDCAAIAEIYNDAIVNTAATFDTAIKNADDLAGCLTSRDLSKHPFFVATHNDVAIAWVALNPWSDRCAYANTAEISIYVHKDHRGHHVGSKLMQAILKAGRSAGIHTVLSRITSDNMGAIAMTEKSGFKHVGTMREVGRKFGRFYDVCLYQIILGPL